MSCLTIFEMATRNASDLPGRPDRCTDFQLHAGKDRARNVIDFTERKLIQYALKTKDAQQKLMLMALIEDYRNGTVAVAWRRGLPVPLRVTRDT
jgi:hypothetical protein